MTTFSLPPVTADMTAGQYRDALVRAACDHVSAHEAATIAYEAGAEYARSDSSAEWVSDIVDEACERLTDDVDVDMGFADEDDPISATDDGEHYTRDDIAEAVADAIHEGDYPPVYEGVDNMCVPNNTFAHMRAYVDLLGWQWEPLTPGDRVEVVDMVSDVLSTIAYAVARHTLIEVAAVIRAALPQ